jgi:hypothetical protein
VQLRTVYALFFRSLNHDQLRASDDRYLDSPDPWDATPAGANDPVVRVRLERDVTTVVGGDESGKSQMLGAIRGALTGGGFDRSDFCRYSPFCAHCTVLEACRSSALNQEHLQAVGVVGSVCVIEIRHARAWKAYELGATDTPPRSPPPNWLEQTDAAELIE